MFKKKNDVPAHMIAKINEFRFKLLSHSPYSPDFSPSDFFLFPKLKSSVRIVFVIVICWRVTHFLLGLGRANLLLEECVVVLS